MGHSEVGQGQAQRIVSLDSACKESGFSLRAMLEHGAEERIRLFARVPAGHLAYNVHEDTLNKRTIPLPLGLSGIATPEEYQPVVGQDTEGLLLKPEDCLGLEGNGIVTRRFFRAACKKRDKSAIQVVDAIDERPPLLSDENEPDYNPYVARIRSLRAPGWRYAIYPANVTVRYSRDDGFPFPELAKFSHGDVFVLEKDLDALIASVGRIQPNSVFDGGRFLLESHTSQKLRMLFTIFEKTWQRASPAVTGEFRAIDKQVEDALFRNGVVGKGQSRALARSAAEMIRPLYAKAVLCSPAHRKEVQDILRRADQQQEKVEHNFSPEMQALVDVSAMWRLADMGHADTYPKREAIVAALSERGLSKRLANAGATIICPENAKSGRPAKR